MAYKTTSKALQILEQRRADGKLDDAPEDASNERKHMHELCEVQSKLAFPPADGHFVLYNF